MFAELKPEFYSRRLLVGVARTEHALQARFQSHTSHAEGATVEQRGPGYPAPDIHQSVKVARLRQTLHGYPTARHHETDHFLRPFDVLLHFPY